jgi:ribose 1,5-bisphosphokinase
MQHLVYVIGPSGAGKDSVLQTLRTKWVNMPLAHWAKRTITRSVQAGGEQHESVEAQEFERLLATNAFAMSWQANGLSYGIRRAELAPLAKGECVFVNGSRAHLPLLLHQWPEAAIVLITAPEDVLAQRLQTRAREDNQAIAKRLARAVELDLPSQTIQIINNSSLETAAEQLLAALRKRWQLDPE